MDYDRETKEVMRHLKHQIALANVQELLATVSCKCFEKCVTKPRDHLSGPEENCINMCMDRFLDSFRLCAHTYGQRLRREQSQQRG
ncbi:GH11842 [Drosophila grimshawi]|uniref:Mitochondrial import inner membrane translocase subunit n=1 Tax=Drosophila grimshawi TaxID=7222 RepID=B4JIN7_DROGR|nr:GH11842 [Drosophila grimshawi]